MGRLSYTHLKMHGMTVAEYREEFPGAPFMNEKERKGISDRPGMSEEARKAASERVKGDKNPGYQHGGRLSPLSKKFVKGYDEDWNKKFAAEQSQRMVDGGWLPNLTNYWVKQGYSQEEAEKLISESQARGRQFYVDQGLTPEEAEAKVQERNQRWYATCQANFGANTPLECLEIWNRVAEKLGWIPKEQHAAFEEYVIAVWKVTRQELPHVPDIELRSIDLHVDHIFSVAEGFRQGVPPEVIGHRANLRMLSAVENKSKGSRCDKTLEQLHEDIDNANASPQRHGATEVC